MQLKQERGKTDERVCGRVSATSCRSEFPGVQFFFQPADIVTQILNFGTPAPIDIADHRDRPGGRTSREALKLEDQMRHIPGAVDVHVQQAFDSPTLHMDIDRTRRNTWECRRWTWRRTCWFRFRSSFQTAPTFWLDPKNGVSYNVAVQTPQYRVDNYQALQNTPINGKSHGSDSADSGQPGDHDDGGAAGVDFALQRAADDQCVCVGLRDATLAAVADEVAKRVADIQKRIAHAAAASSSQARFKR